MSTLLVTRPLEEAKPTAAKLEAMGYHVMMSPMLKVEPVSFEIPDESRSIIVTSKNGARMGLANREQGSPDFCCWREHRGRSPQTRFYQYYGGPRHGAAVAAGAEGMRR